MQIYKRDENLLSGNIGNNINHGSAIRAFEFFGEMSEAVKR
jgi:hypothetical protein